MNETDPAPFRLELILCVTTFAVGAVDIISFSKLGGVFASAMTGNLALFGLYSAHGHLAGIIATLTALCGFITGAAIGHLSARSRNQPSAITMLLGLESLLMLVAAILWFATPHDATRGQPSPGADILIAVLAVPMGLQSMTGKRLNLSSISTVVFTSTLTNIVITLADMLANRSAKLPADTRRQITAFFIYLAGALAAGLTAQSPYVIAVPAAAILAGFVVSVWGR